MKTENMRTFKNRTIWKPSEGVHSIEIVENLGVVDTPYGKRMLILIKQNEELYNWYIHYQNPASDSSIIPQLLDIFHKIGHYPFPMQIAIAGYGRMRRYKVLSYAKSNS
jgi:hypothetical protein